MAIDWNKINAENANSYKEPAPCGKHSVKIANIELTVSKTKGTRGLRFTFEDTAEYTFPKYGTTHWLSFNKESWRLFHFKELMKVLGASEENACKAVSICEDKVNHEDIANAYLDAFKRLAGRNPSVEIEVYYRHVGDKYTECDFATSAVRMGRPVKEVEGVIAATEALTDDFVFDEEPAPVKEDTLPTAKEVEDEINYDDIPF